MTCLTIVHRVELSDNVIDLLERALGGDTQRSNVKLSKKVRKTLRRIDALREMVDERFNEVTDELMEVRKDMATREELNAALQLIITKVVKVGGDLEAHLQHISEQIALGNDVSEELLLAQQIAAGLQTIDDLLPERLTPPPPPPEEGEKGDAPTEGGTPTEAPTT